MSITIKPCTEADLDDLRKVSIETFVETFGDQNTDEDINEYVRNSLSRAELRRQMREQESAFFFAVIDDDVANSDFAGSDVFKAGHHAKAGAFAAARRPDQHDKFAVFDVQVNTFNGSFLRTFISFHYF